MGIHLAVVTDENWLQELYTIMSDDADFNGDNGIGYVSAEARAEGFESDLDYLLHKADRADYLWADNVLYALELFVDEPAIRGYYAYGGYRVEDCGTNSLAVALTYVGEHS